MPRNVLITGGAGFLGSHLAEELLQHGHGVRVLDALTAQVHGEDTARPVDLDPEVELQVGDVRDPRAVQRALDGIDAIVHFASSVGVGQSMYECAAYTDVNCRGTAVLLEAAMRRGLDKLLVASSMSVYGEGLYTDEDGLPYHRVSRSPLALARGRFEPTTDDGTVLAPAPTPETKYPEPASVYALTKYYQERFCLMLGGAYGIPTVALRFFNAYGPRQSLSNPYTGVLAIFASRYLNGRPPVLYEDGRQRRDFVHVRDMARACRMALTDDGADGEVLNIGSGEPRTVLEAAESMARVLGLQRLQPTILGKCRTGDVRHCYADISKARDLLGWEPRVGFEAGLAELAGWLEGQLAGDHTDLASAELERRGLAI